MRILMLFVALMISLPAHAGLRVVATVPDLAAVAEAVGGDHVEVSAMALPTQDPHFLDAKPNLAIALSRADALLLVGLELELGWLPTLLTASRNADIQKGAPGYIDCSSSVDLLEVPTVSVDRSMGDVHPGGNPHYTYDPRAMVQVAHGLAHRFAKLDPAHASDFEAGAAAFEAEVEAALARWATELEILNGMPVVGYHRSWAYLADWLHLHIVADVEPKPGIPPAPAQIARTVTTARKAGAKLLLIEAHYPQKTAALVAENAGASLVRLVAGTDFASGQTYVQHMDDWIRAMADGVK